MDTKSTLYMFKDIFSLNKGVPHTHYPGDDHANLSRLKANLIRLIRKSAGKKSYDSHPEMSLSLKCGKNTGAVPRPRLTCYSVSCPFDEQTE